MVQEVREVQGAEDQQVREDEVQLALHLVKEGEDHHLERWDRGRGSAGGSQGNGGVTGGSQSVGGAAACSQSLVKEGEDHHLERWDCGRGSAGGSQGNGGVTGGSQSVGGEAACSQSLGTAAATSVRARLFGGEAVVQPSEWSMV
ncbi:hypothetical protein Acr_14g0007090 [Actinidia rufa]|uniref:Uncharacterized protein n=1 Tax=Actinidia rufa TaxID=165716 RepID=A0A7J0FR71_9ERIC|nr:hypothetical protein Acr_14g0007090 [Actinidia rufa]